jgi:hypothetical protein
MVMAMMDAVVDVLCMAMYCGCCSCPFFNEVHIFKHFCEQMLPSDFLSRFCPQSSSSMC